MMISRSQAVELFKLLLGASQAQYEEVREGISLLDEQFINIEFKILVDETNKKLGTEGLKGYSSYYRKKITSTTENYFLLRENKNFQIIAGQWQLTTSAFNTSDALDQFCCSVVNEHQAVYGLLYPYNQSFLEKFADGLLYAVQTGSYPVHCLLFLRDLWVDKSYNIVKPFQFLAEIIPTIWIRRPVSEDYTKSHDWKRTLFCGGIRHLQIQGRMQTAVVEFFWYDKEPIKFSGQCKRIDASIQFQFFQQSLGTLFLLMGNASVRMTEFRYTFGCSGGLNSIFDSSPERCVSIKNLDKKLQWIGELMLPIVMNEIRENDPIKRALKYYQDSLFRSLGTESRIALSVFGLEALYLTSEKIQGEITLRLSLRTAKLLSYLGMDSFSVKKNISKAYAVRSGHVHGSIMKESEIQSLIGLSENIDEYLRLSILAFQYCSTSNQPISKVIEELHNADGVSSDVSHILLEVKNVLCD